MGETEAMGSSSEYHAMDTMEAPSGSTLTHKRKRHLTFTVAIALCTVLVVGGLVALLTIPGSSSSSPPERGVKLLDAELDCSSWWDYRVRVYQTHPASVADPSLFLRNAANKEGTERFISGVPADTHASLAVSEYEVCASKFSDYYHCEYGRAFTRAIGGQETELTDTVTRVGVKVFQGIPMALNRPWQSSINVKRLPVMSMGRVIEEVSLQNIAVDNPKGYSVWWSFPPKPSAFKWRRISTTPLPQWRP